MQKNDPKSMRFQVERMNGSLAAEEVTVDSPEVRDVSVEPGHKCVEDLKPGYATLVRDTGGEQFYIRRIDG